MNKNINFFINDIIILVDVINGILEMAPQMQLKLSIIKTETANIWQINIKQFVSGIIFIKQASIYRKIGPAVPFCLIDERCF